MKTVDLSQDVLGQVFWGSDESSWIEVGSAVGAASINQLMYDFMESRFPDFHIYYWRSWPTDKGEIMYDYGSHINFFKIQFPDT